jgi:hypothetical protein
VTKSVAGPVFIVGVARSGTNLVARMLDLHPDVAVALDPLLPVFREIRDLVAPWDAGGSLPDYYGPGGPAVLRAVLDADLDTSLDAERAAALRVAVAERASLEAGDLAVLADSVGTPGSPGAFIDAVLDGVHAVRGPVTLVGVKEVWTVEFAYALASRIPGSRFVFVERDPRAVVASMLALGSTDPTQTAHTVSYLRHWRKHVALSWSFATSSPFSDRVLRLRYEDVVRSPAEAAEVLGDFLGLNRVEAMLGLAQAPDRLRGGLWKGNSSYGPMEGFDPGSLEAWREQLDADALAAASCVCGPEARLALQGPLAGNLRPPDAGVERHFAWADRHPGSWRSDGGSVEQSLELERRRHALLTGGEPDAGDVEECFLTREVYEAITVGGGRG